MKLEMTSEGLPICPTRCGRRIRDGGSCGLKLAPPTDGELCPKYQSIRAALVADGMERHFSWREGTYEEAAAFLKLTWGEDVTREEAAMAGAVMRMRSSR